MNKLGIEINCEEFSWNFDLPATSAASHLAQTSGAVLFDGEGWRMGGGSVPSLGVFPWLEAICCDGRTRVRVGNERRDSNLPPVEALQALLADLGVSAQSQFSGALAGYFSYEFSRFLEPALANLPYDPKTPDFHLVAPSLWLWLEKDGECKGVWTLPKGEMGETIRRQIKNKLQEILQIPEQFDEPKTFFLFESPISNKGKATFCEMVRKARRHIGEGDIYQANLSHRFDAEGENSVEAGWAAYRNLRAINPSPYACWLNFDPVRHIGGSPELLVRSDGSLVETRPIAGTRPRRTAEKEEQMLARELLLNEKERAEHLMLVDLERNDLGRICRTGSVRVDELMTVEKYSHVIHIVSHVSGTLRESAGPVDILRATFPGGTITGAPKIRCMEIISELEQTPRGLYTGSAGYFWLDGSMEWNIIIRTIEQRGVRRSFQAGAGIVADSDPEREWAETLQKAKAMRLALPHRHREAESAPV